MRKTHQNHQNPGLTQKLKVPKWVCRSTLASFCNEPSLFAIFGSARGQIFGKNAEKIAKNRWFFVFFCKSNVIFKWRRCPSLPVQLCGLPWQPEEICRQIPCRGGCRAGRPRQSPKTFQKGKFCIFFDIFWARDHVQGLLQALRFDFPSKMPDLDAYVSSYGHFRCF